MYTSYFDKMAKRKKSDDDIYIQVSRSVSCQKKDLNGIAVTSEIDSNYGEWFGNYSGSFKEYYDSLLTDDVKELLIDVLEETRKDSEAEENKTGIQQTVNFFLLCHENLESKYTEQSREVEQGIVCAGEYQMCHRRILANFVQDKFGIFIPEYDISECNKDIVYRKYGDM